MTDNRCADIAASPVQRQSCRQVMQLSAHRRSAVCRQACHLVGVMAGHLAVHFEAQAVQLLPMVLKVLVITVQVNIVCFQRTCSMLQFTMVLTFRQ